MKEGKCRINIENDQPIIHYIPTTMKQKYKEDYEKTGKLLSTSQCIVKFDVNTWQNINLGYNLNGKEAEIQLSDKLQHKTDDENSDDNENEINEDENNNESDFEMNNNNKQNEKRKTRKRNRNKEEMN